RSASRRTRPDWRSRPEGSTAVLTGAPAPHSDNDSGRAGMAKALDGIVVLDLTQYEAGPSCAQMLGWLGADGIQIEPPRGESGRRALSESPDLDAWFFLMLNSNKRSVRLDLKAPEGRELLKEMVARADVLIENFGPGSFERLGFGWEALKRMNPRIIAASVKGFGTNGPYPS